MFDLVLCFLSSFAIILVEKRELVALLYFNYFPGVFKLLEVFLYPRGMFQKF